MMLLLQFILAHILGDFFLQGKSWISNKERKKWRSVYLYLHVILHGALIILITNGWVYWKQALIIVITHYIIDGAKLQCQTEETKRTWFFADQALHIVVIFVVWYDIKNIQPQLLFLQDPQVLPVIVAGLFLLHPSSFFIKYFIARWAPVPKQTRHLAAGLPAINNKEDESLEQAGRLIGMIERILVFLFILVHQWEAIGFLLAAKSIFRFGELNTAKDRKLTEYVLIGTLISFFIAILTGLITSWLIP